jgi:outer membrane protein OmpA-like peptidoglycan-associated protein
MCFTPTLYRLGPALLILSFLLAGCGGTPSEIRYNDKMQTYVAPADEKATVSTVGANNGVTAHYILRPGNRPAFQPGMKQAQTMQQMPPAQPEQMAPAKIQKADLQLVLDVSDVLFDFDKAVIRQSAVPELDKWAEYLKENPQETTAIYGHADSTGPGAYNQSLSERRAQAVVNYLIQKGVEPKRLTAKGFGETQPAAPNTTSEGRQKNRRVEMKF